MTAGIYCRTCQHTFTGNYIDHLLDVHRNNPDWRDMEFVDITAMSDHLLSAALGTDQPR